MCFVLPAVSRWLCAFTTTEISRSHRATRAGVGTLFYKVSVKCHRSIIRNISTFCVLMVVAGGARRESSKVGGHFRMRNYKVVQKERVLWFWPSKIYPIFVIPESMSATAYRKKQIGFLFLKQKRSNKKLIKMIEITNCLIIDNTKILYANPVFLLQ